MQTKTEQNLTVPEIGAAARMSDGPSLWACPYV